LSNYVKKPTLNNIDMKWMQNRVYVCISQYTCYSDLTDLHCLHVPFKINSNNMTIKVKIHSN